MADPTTLPLWVEYAKALGAPLVALIAAGIAGTIAYRQWRTAQNKLKFDLFQRRLDVYDAAAQMVFDLESPEKEVGKAYQNFLSGTKATYWLFGPEVQMFLHEVRLIAIEAMGMNVLPVAASAKDREDRRKEYFQKLEAAKMRAVSQDRLTTLMEPYLSLKH